VPLTWKVCFVGCAAAAAGVADEVSADFFPHDTIGAQIAKPSSGNTRIMTP